MKVKEINQLLFNFIYGNILSVDREQIGYYGSRITFYMKDGKIFIFNSYLGEYHKKNHYDYICYLSKNDYLNNHAVKTDRHYGCIYKNINSQVGNKISKAIKDFK